MVIDGENGEKHKKPRWILIKETDVLTKIYINMCFNEIEIDDDIAARWHD